MSKANQLLSVVKVLSEKMVVKGIDIYALVAAIDSYEAGPGRVTGKEKILMALGVKGKWKDLANKAGDEGFFDT